MPDVVGQDDEIFGSIKQTAGDEEDTGKTRIQELRSRTSGAVQDKNCVIDMTAAVATRLTQDAVMETQLRQNRAVFEMKVPGDVIALTWLGPCRC